MQRQVLYLGEINDSQEAAWRKTVEVFDEQKKEARQLALFPSDRPVPPEVIPLEWEKQAPVLWAWYTQLVQVEEAFKTLKGDLHLRPVHHQVEKRVEAHILVAFLGYCLTVTLRMKLKSAAPGLTPREVLKSLSAIQMVDVHIPTTDGRELVMPRHTEADCKQQMVLEKLKLTLPMQPPPRIRGGEAVLPAPSARC